MPEIDALVDELAQLHTTLLPLDAYLNEKVGDNAEVRRTESAADALRGRERATVHALARTIPKTAREALALAVVLLDYAVTNDSGSGGADGSGSELHATRSLVSYLAGEAEISPEDLGIFRDRLHEVGIAPGELAKTGEHDEGEGQAVCEPPSTAIAAKVAQLVPLWLQHDDLDSIPSDQKQADQRRAAEAISESKAMLERDILTSQPETAADALCIAILVHAYAGSVHKRDLRAAEAGAASLVAHLTLSSGTTAAALGLDAYWSDEQRAKQLAATPSASLL